jgi:HD-like signal output (HDOD) protein
VETLELTPESLTSGVKDLVTLPDVAMRIARMVDDPKASAADIGREISNDAALTARLLRIANSAAYGQHDHGTHGGACVQRHIQQPGDHGSVLAP